MAAWNKTTFSILIARERDEDTRGGTKTERGPQTEKRRVNIHKQSEDEGGETPLWTLWNECDWESSWLEHFKATHKQMDWSEQSASSERSLADTDTIIMILPRHTGRNKFMPRIIETWRTSWARFGRCWIDCMSTENDSQERASRNLTWYSSTRNLTW